MPDDPDLRRLHEARAALRRIRSGESPSPEELAAAPQLDFWCLAEDDFYCVLQGVVTGHPRLADGALIGTSPLLWLSQDATSARTVSRFYRLGVRLQDAIARQ